mgnify:CR=1 FL=1|jgi:hypothetical protein
MFKTTNSYCGQCTTTSKCTYAKWHTGTLRCCICNCDTQTNNSWKVEYQPKGWMGNSKTKFYCSECWEFKQETREQIKKMLGEDKGYRNMNLVPNRFKNDPELKELEYWSYIENGNY